MSPGFQKTTWEGIPGSTVFLIVDHYYYPEFGKVDLYKELSLCSRSHEMEYPHIAHDCTSP